MLQSLLSGIVKLRALFPCSAGPPNSPLALRVSTNRQGVTATNCSGGGVSLNTVPQPTPSNVHAGSPPLKVVPYRLPCASRTKPAVGVEPSPPVPVKL